MTLKIAALAPIPIASDSTATVVKPGVRSSTRIAWRRSSSRPSAAAERLAALDQAFSLSRAGNSELRFAFLTLVVANRYDPAVPALEEFLTMQGRRKFVKPLIDIKII